MKKIIIFGGRGFIGQHLVNFLKTKKFKIYILANKNIKLKTSTKVFKLGKIIKIDYNFYSINNYINDIKPDIILYLSGNPSFETSKNSFCYDLKSTNLIVSYILDSILQLNIDSIFWFGSSVAVYGNNSKILKENFKTQPISFYGLSKAIAEKQCEYYAKSFNLKIGIMRIFSCYGPGLKRQIIYETIDKFKNKNPPYYFYGSGNEIRDLIFIDDMVKAIFNLLNYDIKKFEIFNIGTGKGYSVKYIVKLIANELGISFNRVVFLNKNIKKTSSNKSVCSINFLKNKTGFKISHDIKSGIKKTIAYWI